MTHRTAPSSTGKHGAPKHLPRLASIDHRARPGQSHPATAAAHRVGLDPPDHPLTERANTARQSTFRDRLQSTIAPEQINAIRQHLQCQHVLGPPRCRQTTEATSQRRAAPARIGMAPARAPTLYNSRPTLPPDPYRHAPTLSDLTACTTVTQIPVCGRAAEVRGSATPSLWRRLRATRSRRLPSSPPAMARTSRLVIVGIPPLARAPRFRRSVAPSPGRCPALSSAWPARHLGMFHVELV